MVFLNNALSTLSYLPDLYVVGGAVRDYMIMLQRQADRPTLAYRFEPHDIDLATSARPERVMELATAAGHTPVATGLDHGTITIRTPAGEFEVTTFRRDVSTDGRRATVEFATDIVDDLARRDFTINAIAFDGENFVNPFGGIQDLKDRVLRAVGQNPMHRFLEDYLRVVRAARFAAKYGLEIEPLTLNAALRTGSRVMGHVSVERVTGEFDKAFAGNAPAVFLEYLQKWGVLRSYLFEIDELVGLTQNPAYHPEGDAFVHTLGVVDRAPSDLRWHALFHDVGKGLAAAKAEGADHYTFRDHAQMGADIVYGMAAHIKLPLALAAEIEFMTRLHMRPLELQNALGGRKWDRKVREFQGEVYAWASKKQLDFEHVLGRLGALCEADAGGRRPEGLRDLFVARTGIAPVVTGAVLLSIGIVPGPVVGEVMADAWKYQLASGETNCKRILREVGLGR